MTLSKKRIAIPSLDNSSPQKRKRFLGESSFSSSLFDQPFEIIYMIADKLTLEDAFNFASTCKTAHVLINAFQATLKYDWVDNMFLNLESTEDKAKNSEYLLVTMLSIAKKNGQNVYKKLFDWLCDAPEKCPNLSMPLLLETLLNRVGEKKCGLLIESLIKDWMLDDANQYLQAFPVGPESSSKIIEVEKRLLKRYKWIISDSLMPHTKAFLFTFILRSLAKTPDVHKLIYLFCAPRQEKGFIDFEYYLATHQEADEELKFGDMADAFKLILDAWKSKVVGSFTNREVFIILEDLTTSPAAWSMHSFVKFLLTNVELCILSTYIRFNEGYHEDAASTFYYTIRANAQSGFLAKVVCGILRYMNKDLAVRFVDHVMRKSSQVIGASDETNKERMKMLQDTHRRALTVLTAGLSKYRFKYTYRSSSV